MDEELVREMIAQVMKEAIAPLVQSQQQQFHQLRSEIGNSVSQSSNEWLDSLISESESYEDDDDYDYDYDDDEDEDEEYEYREPAANPKVLQKTRELESAFNKMKAELESERTKRTEAETKAKRDAMMGGALDALQKTGQVRNPRQLLSLLQQDGVIQEQDGQLMASVKDAYGITTTKPLSDESFLGSILGSDDYAHFANARPGTGTGATPSSSNSGNFSSGKYFGDRAPDSKELMEIMSDPNKAKDLLRELDSLPR